MASYRLIITRPVSAPKNVVRFNRSITGPLTSESKRRALPPDGRPQCVYLRGLVLSPDNLLKDLIIQCEIGDGTPKPGVFLLDLLHTLLRLTRLAKNQKRWVAQQLIKRQL